MNFRRRIVTEQIGLQLAPMIDVVLFLLCFFILTWNLARYEADIEVKVPTARNGQEPKRLPGEVIVNIAKDGAVNLNRRVVSSAELQQILAGVVQQYPDQAVIIRADADTNYKNVVGVLDACRAADAWNIAFATLRPGTGAAAAPSPQPQPVPQP
jgi:biopolymer transport protein ExbD